MRGWFDFISDRPAEAEAAYTAARELYAETGTATREAVMTMMIGRAAFAQGDLERAEGHLREATRMLKGLGDRGSLCEAQRALAMVLVKLGRIDEAERWALEARETVGSEDRVSISTTKFALGIVRAAQKRDAEAEALIHEAVEGLQLYELRGPERWALRYLVEFYRRRGRARTPCPTRRGWRALAGEHRRDRLSRRFVGRLADHNRRSFEGASASRSGSARGVPSPYGSASSRCGSRTRCR